MSQLIEMLFKSTLLIQSGFEELWLEPEISKAGGWRQQNNCGNCSGHGENVAEN